MDTTLPLDLVYPPDLTDTLRLGKKRIVGHGIFGTVFRWYDAPSDEVAVKAITFHHDETERHVFMRKVRRELGIWRRLDHPNIAPFLGTACGEDFGSDYPCMVSMWMSHGTLTEYLEHRGTMLLLPSRIQLIKGSVAGLEYLHSQRLVHGDFHPGNILIDGEHNARLTDFGLSQTLSPHDQLTYLWTDSIRPGAAMWAAPELQYPDLYPGVKIEATLHSDIYSLGSIILFILSGKYPWRNEMEVECKLKQFQNPPRPAGPDSIPDGVWNFIERCWSPRRPTNRPSAQEALTFSRGSLEQLLQPNPAPDINVVLYGAVGCDKSSITNLQADEPLARVSRDVICTKRPQISIGGMRIRLWDTMEFRLPHGGEISPLSSYERAHAVLRNIPSGVNLILLCTSKDGILVVTHLDTLDERWWECNQGSITEKTGILVRSIPHACVTTVQTGRDESKQALKALLWTYTTATPPIYPRLETFVCEGGRNLGQSLVEDNSEVGNARKEDDCRQTSGIAVG